MIFTTIAIIIILTLLFLIYLSRKENYTGLENDFTAQKGTGDKEISKHVFQIDSGELKNLVAMNDAKVIIEDDVYNTPQGFKKLNDDINIRQNGNGVYVPYKEDDWNSPKGANVGVRRVEEDVEEVAMLLEEVEMKARHLAVAAREAAIRAKARAVTAQEVAATVEGWRVVAAVAAEALEAAAVAEVRVLEEEGGDLNDDATRLRWGMQGVEWEAQQWEWQLERQRKQKIGQDDVAVEVRLARGREIRRRSVVGWNRTQPESSRQPSAALEAIVEDWRWIVNPMRRFM